MPKAKIETAEAKVETVAAVAEEVKETAAAEKKKSGRKPAAEKKAPAKKPAAKKATAAKKTTAASAEESKVVIQANGSEVNASELVEKAKAASGVKKIKKVDVYVKPEVNKVYYVVNGDTFGDFDLF